MDIKVYDIFEGIMGIIIIIVMGHFVVFMKSLIWFGEVHLYEPNLFIAIIEGIFIALAFSWFSVKFFYSIKDRLKTSNKKRRKK